jgi:putative transcriptional regulator
MPPSLKGHLLIAARALRDGNFFRSVVLMIEHSPEGAMGLIINHPSETPLKDAISQHFEDFDDDRLLYVGGPVERTSLLLLHNVEALSEESSEVLPDVYIGGSTESFAEVIERCNNGDADLRFRVYSGYSGWGAGQLEGEIERNDWLSLPAESDLVFGDDPYSVWDEAVTRFRKAHPLVPAPKANDPGLN